MYNIIRDYFAIVILYKKVNLVVQRINCHFLVCKENLFTCDNGDCIKNEDTICNGLPDCSDNSDELNCGKNWESCVVFKTFC